MRLENIKIGERHVGETSPCFIIAEAGVNHDGSVSKAKELIDAAVEAKADAVKFQSFTTDKLILSNTPKAEYHKKTTGDKDGFDDMLRQLELSESDHIEIRDYCDNRGIAFMSTPFDPDSADLLERLGVNVFKVDSGNFNNPYLVKHIAIKDKPMILSTGMTTISEIEETMSVLEEVGNKQAILLHCTSNYPPSYEDVNLRAMMTIRNTFNTLVGYSDHTQGLCITIAAVAMGATVIEKHLTLDRSSPGPDHLASLEPREFSDLVSQVRSVEASMGSSIKRPVAAEAEVADSLRRSVVSTEKIHKGQMITRRMVDVKRPGTGLPPKYLEWVVGRVAQKDIPANQVITFKSV